MSGTKAEVLIVDRQTDSLMDLFDLVCAEGFDTTGVSSESEALSCVLRRKPDILIDYHRPPVGGDLQLLERTRQLSPHTRIILLAGSPPGLAGPGGSSKSGEVEWIPGPVLTSQLLEALDRAVQGRPAQ
jgi:DNA-binding NtrC family response regulator